VCKHTKLKTTHTGNNTLLIHTTQKTKKNRDATSIQISPSGQMFKIAIWYIYNYRNLYFWLQNF